MEDKKERKKLSLAAKTFIGFGIGIVIGLFGSAIAMRRYLKV